MNRRLAGVLATALLAALAPLVAAPVATAAPQDLPQRGVEAVVLTGAQLPTWSQLPAQGVGKPHPSGGLDGVRDAHNGTVTRVPDVRKGADPQEIAAYRWNGKRFVQIPVQVDERFPYFLANANSDFGIYSGTDQELTYEWDVESWKKTAGVCNAEYPPGVGVTQDPEINFDDDDEVSFMASDAGQQAPATAAGPRLSNSERQEIRLVDPRDPSAASYVYLFRKPGGSSFTRNSGYVAYQRDANADQWIDKSFFPDNSFEKLGTSNSGYGANLSGTVCPDGSTPKPGYVSGDRFPRDGVTVSTDAYRFYASGRWMIREMRVTKPGTNGHYGPDLIDRWKGRAFQSSPDSTISVVGFEDEQVNWEGNSSLIGERSGPVRAIREVWGADSGTNTTKTEFFYRDTIVTKYHLRVHPIPSDGLYTSWDHNHNTASTYYNETKTAGVAIDGINDDAGNIDSVGDDRLCLGQEKIDDNFPGKAKDQLACKRAAYFDVPDPTFSKPQAILNWEQVSGKHDFGSLVYITEMKNAQGAENPTVVPYYRDDACFDDGTGDNPSPRPWPGESSTDKRVIDGNAGKPCLTQAPAGHPGPFKQGAFGSHGVHFFFTNDTDNSFSPAPTTELVAQETQFAVPTSAPTNVGDRYGNVVKTPLQTVVARQANPAASNEPAPTQTEVTGDRSVKAGQTARLAARVTSDGIPVTGVVVYFKIGDTRVGGSVTDENGVASIERTVAGPARSTTLTANFNGNEDHAYSSVTVPFRVTP